MTEFTQRDIKRLATCDEKLQKVMNEAIKETPFMIICGRRNKEAQDKAYLENKSRVMFPNSKHNSYPSKAVDIAPLPLNWNDIDSFIELSQHVLGAANKLGINIIWGGNWKSFKDYPHYELEV